MGVPTWRPPLPRTATPEEMQADLDALVADIRRQQIVTVATVAFGAVAAFAIVLMFIAAA